MPDWILKFLRLTPRLLFGVWLFAAVALLAPESFVQTVGLDQLREDYRSWLGVAGVGAFTLWMAHMLTDGASHLWNRFQRWRSRRKQLKRLNDLSRQERVLLAYFVFKGSPTQYIWLHYPPARSLCAKRLMIQVPGEGNMFAWPYVIPEHVWGYLNSHSKEVIPELHDDDFESVVKNFRSRMRHFSIHGTN